MCMCVAAGDVHEINRKGSPPVAQEGGDSEGASGGVRSETQQA